MTMSTKHLEREAMAATIKGLSLNEHFKQKSSIRTRDPADEFASWHERFRHELESEFGELPDENDEIAIKDYIKHMRKQFRLRLK
jgi:hypothetical protein